MAFGPSVTATFGADTGPLAKGSTEATGIVAGFASSATAALSTLGLTLGAGAILGFFKTVIEKGGALQDLSDRLEVGTDELQAFDFAVRQAGGTTEMANSAWDKSRKALDSLAAGQEGVVKQFAALGLGASDFIGLDLPASLEKITRGYSENTERAGAYDAVMDILGSRSAPQLNAVLLKLAADGFPAFIKGAKDAGQVMSSEAVARMDEFGDRADALKGKLMSWGASVFNALGRAADGMGIVWAYWANAADGIETSINRTDFIAEKAVKTIKTITPALVETTEQLKRQKDIKEESAKWDTIVAKATLDQLEPSAKLVELQRRMMEFAAKAAAAGTDELARQKAMNAGGEIALEIRKLETAERTKLTAAMRLGKDEELEYAKLAVKATKGLTAEEGVRLNVLKLQQAQLKNEYEIKTILGKGVLNLTADDKARLDILFKQNTLLEEQKKQADALIAAAKAAADAQGGGTKALKDQVEEAQKLKDAVDAAARSWDNYHVAVSRTGKGYSEQSTTALEGVRDRLQSQLSAPSPNSGRAVKDANMNQDYGGWLMAATYSAELNSVMRELDQRKSVASYAQRYGQDAATYKFGDDLTNRALADLNSTQQRTSTAVETIATTLKRIL